MLDFIAIFDMWILMLPPPILLFWFVYELLIKGNNSYIVPQLLLIMLFSFIVFMMKSEITKEEYVNIQYIKENNKDNKNLQDYIIEAMSDDKIILHELLRIEYLEKNPSNNIPMFVEPPRASTKQQMEEELVDIKKQIKE